MIKEIYNDDMKKIKKLNSNAIYRLMPAMMHQIVFTKKEIEDEKKAVQENVWFLLLYALLNTTLHYAFFYFGLSHNAGARSAILNSMSVFTVVILACIFFKSDRMTWRKALGCIIGFLGILALNLGGKESGSFTFLGDGMIILNALCGASASLLTRGLSKRVDVFVGTGYSLSIGGALLVIPALLMGGYLPVISLWGITILLLLIAISTISFALYNKLLSCNPVGKVAIYNSLIPVVGAITSCLCLGEAFYWKYLIAGALATAGIYIINKGKKINSGCCPCNPYRKQSHLFQDTRFVLLILDIPLYLTVFLSPIDIPGNTDTKQITFRIVITTNLLTEQGIDDFG